MSSILSDMFFGRVDKHLKKYHLRIVPKIIQS